MAAEDREETKDFNAEEGEREDVRSRREAGGENSGSHERGIGREGSWESVHSA